MYCDEFLLASNTIYADVNFEAIMFLREIQLIDQGVRRGVRRPDQGETAIRVPSVSSISLDVTALTFVLG